MSFTEKELLPKTYTLNLVRGYDPEGRLQYFYIMAKADKLIQLTKKLEAGESFNIKDYGTVIESGFGEPSTELMIRMRDEYGFDHGSDLKVDPSYYTTKSDTENKEED